MSLVKRGNSKFWYVQFQLGGRTVIQSSRTTNKRVAEQFEVQLRAKVHAEQFLGQQRSLTLEQALTRFVATKSGTPNHRNLVAQQKVVLRYLRGSQRLEDVRSEQLERFRAERAAEGIGPQTIHHAVGLVRGAWKLAKRQGYRVSELVFPTIRIGKGRTRYLTLDEERALLAAVSPSREGNGLAPVIQRSSRLVSDLQDTYDLVVLLIDTGARHGEIARLEWQQIDLDRRVIQLWRPKVANESLLFMTGRVHAILSRRREVSQSKYVFTNRAGGPRGYTYMSLRKAFDRAGLKDCTVHTLRHTHASRLIQNGLSLYEVQKVLGHSDAKTTMRYAHLEQVGVTQKARDIIERLTVAS